MYPYLLPNIFEYSLPMYDLLVLLGIVLMIIYVVNRLEKKEGLSRSQSNQVVLFLGISLVSALLFSLLLDGIFHSIKEGELKFGSVSFLTALIGGFGTFLILMKRFYKGSKSHLTVINNALITGVVLGHATGRVGCFCAGCCHGIPTTSHLGVIFPHGHAHEVFPNTSIYPTQLFESFFLFFLFILLTRNKGLKNKEIQTYLIGYGIFRFAIEFIRGDNRGVLLPIIETTYNIFPTPSQLISLIMIVLGIYLVFRNKQKLKDIIL